MIKESDLSPVGVGGDRKIILDDFANVAVFYHPVVLDVSTLDKLDDDAKRLTQESVQGSVEAAAASADACAESVSRAALLVMVIKIMQGRFGIRRVVVQTLVDMINNKTTPVFHSTTTTLNASAGMELVEVLMGQGGNCFTPHGVLPAKEALKTAGISSVQLSQSEASTLIHCQFFTTGASALFVCGVSNAVCMLDVIASLTCEASCVNVYSFDSFTFDICRQQRGQIASSANVRQMLEGSKRCNSSRAIASSESIHQIPQIHGPIQECLLVCKKSLEIELGSTERGPIASAVDGFNPSQSILAVKNAIEALSMAVQASVSRKIELEGCTGPAAENIQQTIFYDLLV